jgi:hypothetical protein
VTKLDSSELSQSGLVPKAVVEKQVEMRALETPEVDVGVGRVLKKTPVYDIYWRFAAKRQAMFMRRVNGAVRPWTNDPVLASYRFTNVYRAADRVSQYLIRKVQYEGSQSGEEVFFRTILFKIFNRIDTWEKLQTDVGALSWKTFDFDHYAEVLDRILARGERIYSAAYIMPSPPFGSARKHRNHLRLIELMMREGAPMRLAQAHSLREVFELLRSYPSIGDFLAYQFAIDLNYSELIDFSEMEFVVPGPGARDGIHKCFADTSGLDDGDIIRLMTERAHLEFQRLNEHFQTLWGRELQLIDCQNLFCEVGKYARVVHPSVAGKSSRSRIKQKFLPSSDLLPQWYPPKWRLNVPTDLLMDLGAPHCSRQQALLFNERENVLHADHEENT